ncbi:hypothetical protein CkaCkLH20_02078 [Colletotrichum karsti]|uniref:Uncharacterized protein n=1 Tax=Colletotrichum karsti TaxID=1095194 RepID=A0A9P6LL68_9PEZI|nr:uncharacterized protein CkaCkLH20_02078 [Colletotrichum karsti]KAF9880124.1 hypothetical protein CkaCkLH20_02078 [Colletotrichum karsti]
MNAKHVFDELCVVCENASDETLLDEHQCVDEIQAATMGISLSFYSQRALLSDRPSSRIVLDLPSIAFSTLSQQSELAVAYVVRELRLPTNMPIRIARRLSTPSLSRGPLCGNILPSWGSSGPYARDRAALLLDPGADGAAPKHWLHQKFWTVMPRTFWGPDGGEGAQVLAAFTHPAPVDLPPELTGVLLSQQSADVPLSRKKMMLDIVFDSIVPYRLHDGLRLFPGVEFYQILLYNRQDFYAIWPFVARFHAWISPLAAMSAELADNELHRLRAMVPGYVSGAVHDSPSSVETMYTPQTSPQTSPQRSSQTSPAQFPENISSLHESPSGYTYPEDQAEALEADDCNALLDEHLGCPPTLSYGGIIHNMDQFEKLNNAYHHHVQKKAGIAPLDDPTWPIEDDEQLDCVKTLFEQITNMSDFYELRKAQERLKACGVGEEGDDSTTTAASDETATRKRRRTTTGSSRTDRPRPKGVSKADWDLMDPDNSPADLLTIIVHTQVSDLEIELMCWKLLVAAMNAQRGFTMRPRWCGQRAISTWDYFETFAERWEVICAQLLDCKLLIHSLTRPDWFSKFAGAPVKERASKLSNDVLNGRRDVQNQVGRELIKAKTQTNEWETSKSFEIRSKNGEVISKGAKIGDGVRRRLAVRAKDQDAGSPASQQAMSP